MKRVIGYARTSSDNQKKEETINIQVDIITKYAEDNNLELVDIIKDEAVSGRLKWYDRPGLKKLKEVCDEHDIDTVLIKCFDRLGRSVCNTIGVIGDFEEDGIEFFSIQESYVCGNTPGQKFAKIIVIANGELESATINERMESGKKRKVKEGKYVSSNLKYGYKRNDRGDAIIDEDAAGVVRKIFQLYPKNGAAKVANILNSNSIKSPKGGMWGRSTIQNMVRSKRYLGYMDYDGEECMQANHDLQIVDNRTWLKCNPDCDMVLERSV